jgi:transposase
MPTSPDTLLRRVLDSSDESMPPPRYIGVDDWAIRKGHSYGTILIDLERSRVIDILPGRDGEALKTWLQAHPGVEVISRDRWAAYAHAAGQGAPQAIQVADRWHLLKNLREAIERLLQRRSDAVKGCRDRFPLTDLTSVPAPDTPSPVVPAPVDPKPPSPRQQIRQAKRQRRVERYEHVRALHQQGTSIRGIARELTMSVRTVLRYLRESRCPDWHSGRARPTRLDGFREYVDRRIGEGCHNAAQLHRELADRGCRAAASSVRSFVSRRLAAAGQKRQRINAAVPSAPRQPSAKTLSFEFLRRASERKTEEQARMELLRRVDAELTEALDQAATFAAMARKEVTLPLAEWLAQVGQSSCPELRHFAEGLRQDEAAVAAALRVKWSNGPVEGHVNRLKTIKRQMYGRAGLELLRARVRKAG